MRSMSIVGNVCKFLMDGEQFFGAIRTQLEGLATEPVVNPAKSYLRMAFWAIAVDLFVGDETRGRKQMLQIFRDILAKGHNIDIIGWYPNYKSRKFGGHDGKFNAEKHDELATGLESLDRASKSAHGGRVRFYMERYEGWTGGSQHQKIFIVSRNGQRTAIVAGLNMANYYYDNVAHADLSGTGAWHDTAVMIQGPVTTVIEAEWMRRWNKAVAMQASLVTLNDLPNQVRSRYDPALPRSESRRRAVAIELNDTVQTVFTGPPPGGALLGPVTIQIATTRSTTTSHEKDIREILCAKILAAQTYVYIENVQLTDPEIVRALYRRKFIKPDLNIIVVNTVSGGGPSYCTRRAWLQIALRCPHPELEEITYLVKEAGVYVEKSITRQAALMWNVTDCTDNGQSGKNWCDGDTLSFREGTNPQVTLKFSQILSVKTKLYFYTPRILKWNGVDGYTCDSIMVHSKLAVIDGQVAVIGSSNWTYRSMNYDGEMAAFIESPLIAAQVIRVLLKHWQTFGPALTPPKVFETAVANIDAWANSTIPQDKAYVCLFPANHCSYDSTDFNMLNHARYSPTELKNLTQEDIRQQRALVKSRGVGGGPKKAAAASHKKNMDVAEASISTIKAMPDFTWY